MNEPQVNVDHFYHRPVYNVVGLLTDQSQLPAITSDLRSAGVDVAAVEILCGERGARILDADGRYHGLRGRVVRTLQRMGYDGTTLAIYDEALRDGDLLYVPVRHDDRQRIAALLQRHQVHDAGPARSSSSHPEYGVSAICPGTAGRLMHPGPRACCDGHRRADSAVLAAISGCVTGP